MNKPMPSTDQANAEYNRMRDAARRRAQELRAQAMEDVWFAGQAGAVRLLRSMRLFAASLRRHRLQRAGGAQDARTP